MREIKFRAWHVKDRAMEHPALLDVLNPLVIQLNGNPLQIEGEDLVRDTMKTPRIFLPDDLVLMQYTGLRDVNGKEIYEGDIVKWKDELLKVEWGSVGWVLVSEMFSSFGRPKGSNCNEVNTKGYTNNSEVIGDIYTTPELLTNN